MTTAAEMMANVAEPTHSRGVLFRARPGDGR
jgi:hypothetical protein